MFHLGSNHWHNSMRSAGDGLHGWQYHDLGELPFFQGEQSPSLLICKTSWRCDHTQRYLLFNKNWAKCQQTTLLASTSFCPEGHDSLTNKDLGMVTTEQAAKILAAGG